MNDQSIQSVLIAALGGEGGGVLADWLVMCAKKSGLTVQATSVPGVAQRTGATSYYVEWSKQPVPLGAAQPVLALSPVPARVDVVIASEGLEAARMMERGFVTPERTCLIASTSRVYTTVEKMHMEDGRFDSDRIQTLAKTLAKKSILFDMEAITKEHNTVVSAVMFGALSGAGVLPWNVQMCEEVIRASGKGVEASLGGFHAGWRTSSSAASSSQKVKPDLDSKSPAMLNMLRLGAERCADYQDSAYADEFRAKVDDVVAGAPSDLVHEAVWIEATRHLALWMCYEDVIRVADLKTRPDRFQRVRAEAQAKDHEIVHVTEHFKPGIDEVASILPTYLGQRLLAWAKRHNKEKFHAGLHIRSTSLWGFLMLRGLARLRFLRRTSLRFNQEQTARNAWWKAMQVLAPQSAEFALALAGLPQVLKGYGETQVRGRQSYERIWNLHVQPVLDGTQDIDSSTLPLKEAIQRALADPEGQLNQSPREQTIQWFQKIPT